jgi:hypothetical protein
VRETISRLASLEALLGGIVAGQIQEAEAWPEGHVTSNRRMTYAALNWCTETYSPHHRLMPDRRRPKIDVPSAHCRTARQIGVAMFGPRAPSKRPGKNKMVRSGFATPSAARLAHRAASSHRSRPLNSALAVRSAPFNAHSSAGGGLSPIHSSLTSADFNCEAPAAKPVRRAAERKLLSIITYRQVRNDK